MGKHRTDANRAVGQVNLADSTSNEWYITGVQLEAGTTASDFEFLPHDVNLQRCMRYYYRTLEDTSSEPLYGGVAQSGASTHFGTLPVTMRASPSITLSSGIEVYAQNTTTYTSYSVHANRCTKNTFGLVLLISGLGAGIVVMVSASSGYIEHNSEL